MEAVNNTVNDKKMKTLNYAAIASGIILVTLVLIKSTNCTGFRNDGKKWALSSLEDKNIITNTELNKLEGNKTILDLDGTAKLISGSGDALKVSFSNILEKENLKTLRHIKGNIILVSNDPALAARAWMLLSQTGISELYILALDKKGEVLQTN